MKQRTPKILLAALLATSVAGVVIAAPSAPKAPPMPRLDANGDGVVDRDELKAHPRLLTRFDALDRNKDGKLSAEEMRPSHDGRGDRSAHGGHRRSPGGHAGPGGMWGVDTNRDGRVSKAEYDAAFARMDVNKDGFIDQADRQARAEQRRTEWFARADTYKDGKLSPAELEAARAKMGPGRGGEAGPRGPMPPKAPAGK